MANDIFVNEISQLHAPTVWYQVMTFLRDTVGLIDYDGGEPMLDNPNFGGTYVQRPRIGQLSTVERANVGSLSTSGVTVRESAFKNEVMVKVHRTMLHEYYDVEPFQSNLTAEAWTLNIVSQFVQRFAQKLLADLYAIALGSCEDTTTSHQYSVYQDTATAGDQVDMTVDVIQQAKYELDDQMENLDIGVCHAKQWNDSRIDLISSPNQSNVPNVYGDLIRGTLFKNVLGVTWIIDNQIPTTAGSNATRYNALMLRSKKNDPNGYAPLQVKNVLPMFIVQQHVLGGPSAKRQLQAFAAWDLGVRGSKYVVGVGANPSDANLRLSTSWTGEADDNRMHGMVEIATN